MVARTALAGVVFWIFNLVLALAVTLFTLFVCVKQNFITLGQVLA